MNGPRRGMCPSYRKKKMLDFRSLNAKSFFLCCDWLRHSKVRLVIVLGGQVRFPQDSGNGLSQQKGSWVRVCLQFSSPESTSLTHLGGSGVKEKSEICSGHGWLGSDPCKGESTCGCLGRDTSLCAGNRGNDVTTRSRKEKTLNLLFLKSSKVTFYLFFHHLSFLLPPFPHPMAYEQFLPLLLFICFEINFSPGPTYMWTDKFWGRCHKIFPLLLPQ